MDCVRHSPVLTALVPSLPVPSPQDVVVWMLCIRRFQQPRSDAVHRRLDTYVKSTAYGTA